MSDDIQAIKERLRQMRSDNRKVAAENRQLLAELQEVQTALREVAERQKTESLQIESALQAVTKQIASHKNHQVQMRMDRRRRIMAEVRKQANENKRLMTDVHGLQAEIQRTMQVYEAYPSRFKSKQARLSQPGATTE
jgi:chromosome segregation ATPase